MQSKEYFEKSEADAKVHRRIVINQSTKEIALGTTGQVIRTELLLTYGYCVVVRWDLPPDPRKHHRNVWPYEDWFNKAMYEQLLSEVLT